MIVGIGYNYGVGKDTAAQALCRELGYRQKSFAAPLKELALELDPLVTTGNNQVNVNAGRGRLKWTVQGLGWDEAKRIHPEVREILQRLGAGARRVFGDTFWIDQALDGVPEGAKVVFSDVRYPNEADTIKDMGGMLIKITRPGHHGNAHTSENDLNGYEGWDLVIENIGSVPDLEANVVRAVREELQNIAFAAGAIDVDD